MTTDIRMIWHCGREVLARLHYCVTQNNRGYTEHRLINVEEIDVPLPSIIP